VTGVPVEPAPEHAGPTDGGDADVRPGLGVRILMGAVRGYQLIVSPWMAPRCRYYPSCSQYAIEALRVQGIVRGTGLAVWRVLRCNPWSRGGVDHVPPRRHHHGGEAAAPDSSPTSIASTGGRTLDARTSSAQTLR
jgi:uncharacterized protein